LFFKIIFLKYIKIIFFDIIMLKRFKNIKKNNLNKKIQYFSKSFLKHRNNWLARKYLFEIEAWPSCRLFWTTWSNHKGQNIYPEMNRACMMLRQPRRKRSDCNPWIQSSSSEKSGILSWRQKKILLRNNKAWAEYKPRPEDFGKLWG